MQNKQNYECKRNEVDKNVKKIIMESRNKAMNPLNLYIRRVLVKEVRKFKYAYLNNKITEDGRCKCRIMSQLVQAKKIF